MRRIVVPAAAAAALAFGALAGHADARTHHRSCASPGSKTVFSHHGVRVFAKIVHKQIRYYGCLRSRGRKWYIAHYPSSRRVARHYALGLPAVAGRYLGFAEYGYRAHRNTRVTVVDLRSGRVKFRSTRTHGRGNAQAWKTTALVVTSRGDAAWIDTYRFDRSITEVRKHDGHGDGLLDRGPIQTDFLKASGEKITWARPDGSLSATLEP